MTANVDDPLNFSSGIFTGMVTMHISGYMAKENIPNVPVLSHITVPTAIAAAGATTFVRIAPIVAATGYSFFQLGLLTAAPVVAAGFGAAQPNTTMREKNIAFLVGGANGLASMAAIASVANPIVTLAIGVFTGYGAAKTLANYFLLRRLAVGVNNG